MKYWLKLTNKKKKTYTYCLKQMTRFNILYMVVYNQYFIYSALCLTNLTIRNGSPNPELKYNASKAVNLYLLYTSKGKLVPGPPYP